MSTDIHKNLIEKIRRAWEDLDAEIIGPCLSDNFHYYSWWSMVDIYGKESYMSYIGDRFRSYRKNGTYPLVKLGVNRNDGEYAVALQFGDNLPTLIRIKEEDGRIVEMWMQPAE